MRSNEKMMQLGGALAGLGGTVVVGYWIYTLEAKTGQAFWAWPGIAGVAITGIGLVALLMGFFRRDDSAPPTQHQVSGKNSSNYQAGRDMRIGREDSIEE